MRTSLYLFLTFLALIYAADPVCDPALSDQFSCYYEASASTMWVAVNYSANGVYNCQNACRSALCHTGSFYRPDIQRRMNKSEFMSSIIPNLAGIQCSTDSWAPVARLAGSFVFRDSAGGTRPWLCAVPSTVLPGSFREKGPPASASVICPCVAAANLEEACPWSDRAAVLESPAVSYAKFDDPSYSACLREVNRRRKQACDEKWPICPPCGLPPMVECKACDACTTSVAKASFENGPHSGGGRCSTRAAGEAFAQSTCKATIAGLIGNELSDTNNDGVFDTCTGHCGPFYRPGCESFSFGRWETTATFQFGSVFSMTGTENCPGESCLNYCATNPGDIGCVKSKFVNDTDSNGVAQIVIFDMMAILLVISLFFAL